MDNKKNEALLTVKDLVVEYTSGKEVVQAVNDVSFEITEGETLGLVGETGAGKTTIAKSIMSILPDPPAKVRNGQILFKGQDILKMREKDVRKIRGKKNLHDLSGSHDCLKSRVCSWRPDRGSHQRT